MRKRKRFKRKKRVVKKSTLKLKRYLYLAEYPDNSAYFGKTHITDLDVLSTMYNKTTNTYFDKTGLKPIFTILTPLKNDFVLDNIMKHLSEVFKENNYNVLNTFKIYRKK